MKTTLLAFALVLAVPALAGESDAPAISDPAAFADALESCTVATHIAPHPFMKSFTIEHAITGGDDEACLYSQTMPGGMHMECRLSEGGRGGLAGEFRDQAQGRMSGGTGAQPAWTGECEIVDKAGKRSPMTGG